MSERANDHYDKTQKVINAKNKIINRKLHEKGKKTSKKQRNKRV